MNGVLSTEDIDRIAEEAIDSESPELLAASLVDAVEHGRLKDDADVSYALIVAAEITADAGQPDAAIALAERGIEAYEQSGNESACYPMAVRADVLFLAGRDEEAMTQLSLLRDQLTQDSEAATLLSDVLVSNGRAETAEAWLTEALGVALRRHDELDSELSASASDEVAMVAFELLQARHAVRHELELPHDDHDDLADELLDALEEPDDGPVLMFLPRPEYDEALSRWPQLAADCGATWDEHRAMTERDFTSFAEHGAVRLAAVVGSADGLAAFATATDSVQLDGEVLQAYSDSLVQAGSAEVNWPPGRNDPCWCGSTTKYKKCCLPRS